MKFTQVNPEVYKNLQLNAGVLLSSFDPSTKTISTSNIIGATSGGVSFSMNPEYTDFGEDIDNLPGNTMQLKRMTAIDPSMSGTFKSVTPSLVKQLIAAADSVASGTVSGLTTITPRNTISTSDFSTVWWVGDYSDVNTGNNAGFIAIKMSNVLNTAGFSIQSNDDGKGDFSFEYHAHFDITNIDKVPFEVYTYIAA